MNGPALLPLATVWYTTLVLLGFSSLVFLALLVIRSSSDAREMLLLHRRKAMETALIIHLSTPLKHLTATLVEKKDDYPVLMEAALRLLRLQRGDSQVILLKALMETGLYPWLLRQLKQGSPTRQIKAISLLTYWPTDEVAQQFLRCLRDGNPAVELAALEGLAGMADEHFYGEDEHFYGEDEHFYGPIVAYVLAHPQIKENLVYEVFLHCGEGLTPTLIQLVNNSSLQPQVRYAALLALGEHAGGAMLEEQIAHLCRDADARMRATACLVCNKAGGSLPVDVLTELSSDVDWRVRQQVAVLLARAEPAPVEAIVRLLGDPNWLVALSVASTLQSLGDKGRRLLAMLARSHSLAGQRARQFVQEGSA